MNPNLLGGIEIGTVVAVVLLGMVTDLLGGIEIGTVVAVVLLGMVTVQIYVYYINFPHDSRVIKTLIGVVWITETAHVAAICYGLYRITITHYGHLELPIPLELCTAAILGNAVHPLVQAIFTARIYQMSQTRQNRLITAVCWALAGFVLGATVLLSIKVFAATSIDQFEDEWDWLILGLFSATAAVDLLIAASMSYYTLRNRALLKPESANKIDTFISWTAQTGVFTTLAAITVTICFATMKQNHIWLALLIVTTGLYSNSLLSLLNGRLQFGYQTEAPFMISLSTFHQNSRTTRTTRSQYPPAIHLKPPSAVLTDNENSQQSSTVGSARSSGMPTAHYTLARTARIQLD
ncbi:hypothetical protein DFH09DRAFT_425976 [Mycena vulgaris]|nr:hypothetical protein DFH09DRAFT_425976 [Mycena vulgaris]